MKKIFFAMLAFMASVSVFAQIDSTNAATKPSDSTVIAPSDSTTVPADTTAAGSSIDSTSVGAADSQISDEDLRKYAVMMDSVDGMKQALITEITGKVKANESITITRYNEVARAIDDDVTLKKLNATPAEIDFVNEVNDLKQQGAAKISGQLKTMAEEIGNEKYFEIKNGLQADADLKTRYDKIEGEVKGDDSASSKTSH